MHRIQAPTAYNRAYLDFDGVDFSSDHTLVKPSRMPYAVNVYKDYKSSLGQAIETFPGFSKLFQLPKQAATVTSRGQIAAKAPKAIILEYSIFEIVYITIDGSLIDSKLYWINKDDDKRIDFQDEIPEGEIVIYYYEALIPKVHNIFPFRLSAENDEILLIHAGRNLYAWKDFHPEGQKQCLFTEMNDKASQFFIFNNACYINDGINYLYVSLDYNGDIKCRHVEGYVPTTFINRIPAQNAIRSTGEQLEQRNLLSPYFKNTFIAPTREEHPLSLAVKDYTSIGITSNASEITVAPAMDKKQQATLTINAEDVITTAGKGIITLTAYRLENPEYIYFPVSENDNATAIAEAVILALKNNALVSTYYTISGVDNKIVLTDRNFAELVSTYLLSEKDLLSDFIEVKVYGNTSIDYTVDYENGIVTFTVPPTRPQDNGYSPDYAGIEITAMSNIYYWVFDSQSNSHEVFRHCTISAVYDNRIFFSGNYYFPNQVWYSMVNDPSYVGVLCFFNDGNGQAPIKGMMTVADTLMVLKADTQQDGSIYYHKGVDTDDNLNPRIYPSSGGLSGLGCLGGYVNFLDDPVFVSKQGLEAIGNLSIKLERAIEHRSTLIDGKFTNESLSKCLLEEWNGYLICLVDGKFYMADSRQIWIDQLGNKQYEWYYIEGVGVYDGQYKRYDYAAALPDFLKGKTYNDKQIQIMDSEIPANLPNASGLPSLAVRTGGVNIGSELEPIWAEFNYVEIQADIDGVKVSDYYLVEEKPDYIGGVFKEATAIKEYNGNIIFGTENGWICSFHFDKRNKYGEIPSTYYHFDGRTIISGLATVFDNCGAPNMEKTTVKKSLVVKCKTLTVSGLKIKVRTNKNSFRHIGTINSGMFNFEDMNFANLTFNTSDQQIFMVNEREKKWVEKQYFIYNDEFMMPFALYYVIHQYTISGKVK